MKMKFRKLIAAVCAGCMLVSNISFADLPEESIPENTEQAAVQQTEELPPSDAVQPEVLPTESEPQPEEQADTPEAQEEQENQPESQQDTPAAQPEELKQEQLTKPDTQTRQESEEAAVHPEQQPKEPKEQAEKQPEELTPEQGAPEATGEEEIIQTLEIGKALSGTLKNGEEYKARLIPEWDMELVFTLKVAAWGENAAHISLNGEEIELIRKDTEKKEETEDPEGTGDSEETEETEASEGQAITYIFEETVTGGETYDFTMTADWEIPFSLKVERKENVTGEKTTQETGNEEDTPRDTTEETEKETKNPEQAQDVPDSTETVYLPVGSLDFTCPAFEVTASFTDGVIPEGTTLEAEEILPGKELYEQLTGLTLDKVTDNEHKLAEECRFLDIRFMLDGEEIEPHGPVDIKVIFADSLDLNDEELQVLHFADGNSAEPEKIEAGIEDDVISFSSNEFSTYGFTATRSTVEPNITDLLTGVKIEGAEYGLDGKLILVSGRKYKIDLSFQESEDHQFVIDGTSMKYKLPAGFTPTSSGTFDMSFGSLGTLKGNTYTINNGYLEVQWNTNDTEMMAILNAAGNAHFQISMEGTFGGTGDKISWNSSVQTEVSVQEQHDLDITKAGEYDKDIDKVKYRVTVNSKGNNTGVKITDTITGSALTSDVQSIGDIAIKNKNDEMVSGATVIVQNQCQLDNA